MAGKPQDDRKTTAPGRFAKFCGLLGYAIFSFVLAALIVELGAYAIWTARHGFRPNREEKLGSASPAYAGYPWAADFWKEEAARRKIARSKYVAFRLWGVTPWHGRFINNDASDLGVVRRTENSLRPACDAQGRKTVWFFGGSTAYGSGVPDDSTIASFLSRDLNSAGIGCVVVTNLGVEGYDSNQELMLLTEELKQGRHPDAVIFFDGFNDSYVGAFAPGFPDAHWDYAPIRARMEGSLAGKLEFLRNSYALRLVRDAIAQRIATQQDASASAGLQQKAGATVDNYVANLTIARILGEKYGFEVLAFWQPSIAYGRKPLAPFEADLIKLDANSPEGPAFPEISAVYSQAEQRAGADFVPLVRLFDDVPADLYLDRWNHLGPKGNELVAAAIGSNVEKAFVTVGKAREGVTGTSAAPK